MSRNELGELISVLGTQAEVQDRGAKGFLKNREQERIGDGLRWSQDKLESLSKK